MYEKTNNDQLELDEFELSFGGKLNPNNRWVVLTTHIPWELLEDKYQKELSSDEGRPAIPVRVALGALIIKAKLNITDRETVEQIKENPYLQYFLGFNSFILEEPFAHSMMTEFRQRLSLDDVNKINELIIESNKTKEKNEGDNDKEPPSHKGQLKIDATVTPADIPYPTDVSLLNESREVSEKLIDKICECSNMEKPRTYRQKARKDFLSFIKKRNRSRKVIRKAIKKQVQYLRRNLKHLQILVKTKSLRWFSKRQLKLLMVIHEVFRQQEEMFNERKNSIEHRIINIYQPHIRPIVRGKAGKPTEFGAKISVSVIDGFSYLDRHEWEAYNESTDVKTQVESYKSRTGFYPEVVCADKIYGSKSNRRYLKELGIRYSGAPLGRPKQITKEEKKCFKKDQRDRNEIEGKFGTGKRRYSLDRIMMKLKQTSEVWVAMIILVMNLDKIVQYFFGFLYQMHFQYKNCLQNFFRESSGKKVPRKIENEALFVEVITL